MRDRSPVPAFLLTIILLAPFRSVDAEEPRPVSFSTTDHATIQGLLYGKGPHSVILVHGAVFNKESWDRQAGSLSDLGFEVLAIDLRGFGESTTGEDPRALDLDLVAAVSYLRARGSKHVSIVGASLGANAAALAVSRHSLSIHRLILLSPSGVPNPQELKAGKTVFLVSRGERFRRNVEAAYAAASSPKALELIEGEAHAQHIFATENSDILLELIAKHLDH